jgi:hypothetical protein
VKATSRVGHHFNEVSKAELVTQVPGNTQDDDFVVEMAAIEQPIDVSESATVVSH